MKRTIWIVTSDYYDRYDHYAASATTKRAAIANFLAIWSKPFTWAQYRRQGYRAVRATVNW